MQRSIWIPAMFLLGLARMPAQDATTDVTLTITVAGTVSLISGPDCLGANGHSASASVMISESATPISSTASSATYKIPAGGVSATVGSTTFSTTKPWSMKITLDSTYDQLVLSGPGPLDIAIKATGTLKKGSWTSAVLLHPEPFSPSPQKQTPSDSKLQYTAPLVCSGTTVLGLTGSVSNSAATSDLPTDDDAGR